ncbi:MAG: hypothetical protein ABL993_12500 [Vicinamibacterales bacterium]
MSTTPIAIAAALVLAVPVIEAQAPAQPDVATVIARAEAYVAAYERDFAMVVAEERYEQEARYPPPLNRRGSDLIQRTVLVSDFLLVRNAEGGWVPFRDVFQQDGTPIRDRGDRLSALFLADSGSAFEQARKIIDESARYNVGSINRNINLPLMALLFLSEQHHGRFAFTDGGRDGAATRVLHYRETGRPTYILTTGGRNLPVEGRLWVNEESGRIERTELHASDRDVEARITVNYRLDADAGLWVPGRMDERYKQPGDLSEIRGVAVYSHFRRFQVKTTEDIPR